MRRAYGYVNAFVNAFRRRMRRALYFAGLGLWLSGAAAVAGGDLPDPGTAWLELPQQSLRVEPGQAAAVHVQPEAVRRLLLHLPRGGSRVNYGTIHTKVNTEPADVGTKSVSTESGIVLEVDLTAAGGFLLRPGKNSVELAYEDQFQRAKYSNFVVEFGDGGDRNVEAVPEGADEPANPRMVLPKQPPRLIAVVIGISQYGEASGIRSLKYADKDAESFAAFLKTPAGGEVKAENLLVLLNKDATSRGIRSALYTFLTRAEPDDTVIIYIAAHGSHDPNDLRNIYLITVDSDLRDLGGTAFPMWQMQDVFARVIKSRHVITLVDTCYSYGVTGERSGETGRTINLFNQYMQHFGSVGQKAVMAASDLGESSQEDLQWGGGHGVFTYYLLEGLKGKADRNRDGVVTAGELFLYVRRSVSLATGGKQNPRAMEGLAASMILGRRAKVQASAREGP